MKTSTRGIDFITEHEDLKLEAYKDTGGVWTIGVGHTGPEVKEGMVITMDRAKELLAEDLSEAEWAVNKYVKVPLTQNQFDALVSFTFNIGNEAFRKSTLVRLLNKKLYDAAAKQFYRWVYDNGKKVTGLINRRADEKDLFLSNE